MRDQVCLTYALMTGMAVNFGTIFKTTMRKAKYTKSIVMPSKALLLNCVC